MQADRLIQEYKEKGHPLGEELHLEETDALILLLRSRLKATEAEAVKTRCRHSHLETFSFHALGFYQKNGYRVFAELENVAGDHKLYFLKKDLCAVGENHG